MFTPVQPKLVTAKLAEIRPWQASARSTVTKSIAVLGFTSTPLLQELENSEYRYRVIAGRRRLDAAVAAGMTDVPALALSAEVGEAEALALALSSNLARSPSPIDEAEELRGLIALTAPNPTGNLLSNFSSYGLTAELELKPNLGAPGGLIRSTYPRARCCSTV
jgi:hypothetical protein